MESVTVKDKTFGLFIAEAEIKERVKEVARQISRDMEGKTPLLLGVLNGAFVFVADLMREITIPCEVSFVKLASYQGTTSTGKVTEVIGINGWCEDGANIYRDIYRTSYISLYNSHHSNTGL